MKRVYRIESGDLLSSLPYDAAIDMQHLEEVFEKGLHSCFISMEQLTSIIPRQTILEGGCVVREYVVTKFKIRGWQGLFDADDIVSYRTIPMYKMKKLAKEFTSDGFHMLYYSDDW